MTAHIIIDPTRAQPNRTLVAEISRQHIDATIWPCIHDANSAVRSINLSHKQIVEHAQREGMEEICIMEEDVWFPAPDGWEYFLRNKPTEPFDLYLGGVYGLNPLAMRRISKEPGYAEIHNFVGLHCYIIHCRYYQKFLELPEKDHIDHQPGLGTYFVAYPFAALQYPGWSANNRQEVDYNTTISNEHIYWGNGQRNT
jgi:hypothetical protein